MKLGALLVTMALVGADGGSQVGSDDIALKVGETTVKARVHQAPGEALRLVNVHDDEDTSVEAGLALIGEFGGRVVELVHRGTRLVQFHLGKQTYLIDPNRMFTDEGARRDLALHGPTSPEALKVVRAFAERYLEVVEPRPGEVLVALHNNSPDPSFSVLAYAKGGIYAHEAAKVHVARDKHPDDFFFVTEPALLVTTTE